MVAPSGFGLFQFGNSPFAPVVAPSGPSGTYEDGVKSLPISELLIDAFERAGVIGVELTEPKIQSGRRSLNLILSEWTNNGPNLWKMEEVIQYMPQGGTTFVDDASCIDILPDSVFVRQYMMAGVASVVPSFSTVQNSNVITVGNLPEQALVGGYISIVVPISVGGLTLQGFYQVNSVPGAQEATFLTIGNATSNATNAGVTPQFTTQAGSQTVTVTMPNHPYLAGQNYVVQEGTNVGGILLFGPYTVLSVPTADTFTISSPSAAGSTQTASENAGMALVAVQALVDNTTQSADPVDIMMYPLSRGDFQAIPNKLVQGRPTSFWVNKQIVPQILIWPVPDANGPYELHYWRHRQIQDADIAFGQTMDIPFRFYRAFVEAVAADLAEKWNPERWVALQKRALGLWQEAADNDRERVSTFMTPDLSGYFD